MATQDDLDLISFLIKLKEELNKLLSELRENSQALQEAVDGYLKKMRERDDAAN